MWNPKDPPRALGMAQPRKPNQCSRERGTKAASSRFLHCSWRMRMMYTWWSKYWRLLCSSFLVTTCFPIGNRNILPKSLQVLTGIIQGISGVWVKASFHPQFTRDPFYDHEDEPRKQSLRLLMIEILCRTLYRPKGLKQGIDLGLY